MKLVTVTYVGHPHEAMVHAFGDHLAASPWLPTVAAEYGIGPATHAGQVSLAETAPMTLDEKSTPDLLLARLESGALPAPSADGQTVYMLFPPAETTVSELGSLGCKSLFSFHRRVHTSTTAFSYAVVPTCPPLLASHDEADNLGYFASIAALDTATDPSPSDEPGYRFADESSPWTAFGAEVGDFCLYQPVKDGDFLFTRGWSNAAAKAGTDPCLPARPGPLLGVTSIPPQTTIVPPGTVSSIQLQGWTSEKTGGFQVIATPWVGGYLLGVSLPNDTVLNDGKTAELTLFVPDTALTQQIGTALVFAYTDPTSPRVWPVAVLAGDPP